MAPKILIVDDEEPILFAMREYFGCWRLEVDCAMELEEARSLLAKGDYGVVVADLRLGGLNGSEGLELVAFAREHCPGTRVVVLTAFGSQAAEQEARRLGALAFLHKPMPLSEVGRIVLGLLAEDGSQTWTRSDRAPAPEGQGRCD